MVRMVMATANEMKYFLFYFYLMVMYFVISCVILDVSYPDIEDESISNFGSVFMQTWRNSLGDIESPSFEKWTEEYEGE
jgi:hypothetical protein